MVQINIEDIADPVKRAQLVGELVRSTGGPQVIRVRLNGSAMAFKPMYADYVGSSLGWALAGDNVSWDTPETPGWPSERDTLLTWLTTDSHVIGSYYSQQQTQSHTYDPPIPVLIPTSKIISIQPALAEVEAGGA